MIRSGKDPPRHPPEPRLPDFSKSLFPGGWGESFSHLSQRIGEKVAFRISVARAGLPSAELDGGSR